MAQRVEQPSGLSRNQSGYTLFLVLVFITILAIMFTIMLRDIQMVRVQAIRQVHRVQARILAESGIEKAEYYLNGNEGKELSWDGAGPIDSFPLFGSIAVENRRFGLYSLLTSIGQRVRTQCRVRALAGRILPDECLPVLALHGKVGGIALMPGSAIKGSVVLSHGRVCKGRTSQEVKDKGLKVRIQELPSLPFDSSQAIVAVEKQEKTWLAACSSGIAREKRGSLDSLDSFDTVVIMGDARLNKGNFTGKCIIAAGELTIGDGLSLTLCECNAGKITLAGGVTEKCLLYSRGKMVVSGGRHNSQCIGLDSIVTGEKATFGPLSLLFLRREGRADSTAGIAIAPRSVLSGTILCSSDSAARTYARVPSIVFGKGSTFTGVCMTDGDVNINGITFKGHLWARSIVTSDDKMAYTNFLFDSRIEEPLFEGMFPLIGSKPVRVLVDPVETTFSIRKRAKGKKE